MRLYCITDSLTITFTLLAVVELTAQSEAIWGLGSRIIIIIIGLFNIAAKGWIEQYAISRL